MTIHLGSFQTRNINFEAGKNYRIELALDNQEDINVLYFVPELHTKFVQLEKTGEGKYSANIELPSDYIKQRILLLGSVFQRIHR